MSLWPFRKRRKTKASDGKKVVVEEPAIERISSTPPSIPISVISGKTSARQKPRRNANRRVAGGAGIKNPEVAYASSTALPPHLASPPSPMETEFRPQKQQREGGFSSYFVEQNASLSDSSTSSHRRHKPSSVFRKFSKRQATDRTQPPPSAYNAQLARTYSKRGKRIRNFDNDLEPRPMSSLSVADSTLSSQSSARAFKIRSLDVFSPRPTLVYDELVHVSAQNPSRANSRTGPDSKHGGRISEEQLASGTRVDELADDLDARGLREVMDRDRRRRERKKQEAAAKLQRRLDRRAEKQKTAEQKEFDFDLDVNDHFEDVYPSPDIQMGESSNSAPGYGDGSGYVEPFPSRGRQDSLTMGTQTPLSWLNDPSAEDLNKGPSNYSPRPGVVTPVSMASNEQDTFVDVKEQPSRHSLSPKLSQHSMSRSIPEEINEYEEGLLMRGPSVPQTIPETEEGVRRAKTSAWTSLIKRATAARIKKEQATGAVRVGESTLVSDSEGEGENFVLPGFRSSKGKHRELEELRHAKGQTPGRYIPDEVAFAMTALETGHIRGRDNAPDERLNPYGTPPPGGYGHSGHSGSQSSSKSSLPAHLSGRHIPRSGSLRYAPSPQSVEAPMDSPTIPQHPRTSSQSSIYGYPKPSSNHRYSPSLQRRSSGAGSPDTRPKSLMSQSLASIDSEGSWLSGKINPRASSIQQMSPLRTSANSLRKRYEELDDGNSLEGDGYFSGVDKKKDEDPDVEGGTYLSEGDDSEDDSSEAAEVEKNIWREGVEKKVVVHDVQKMRTKSNEGLLKEFEDARSPQEAVMEELPNVSVEQEREQRQEKEQQQEKEQPQPEQRQDEMQQEQQQEEDPRKTSELLDSFVDVMD
ncbi:hypothetical protein RUND412_005276 [Rhizina undulata]